MLSKRGGDHDYMMRSEKRPGQRPVSAPPPRRKQRRKPKRHILYAFFTILALIALYPVGLIMLWVRKLRWSAVTKLLASIVTGILFFLLAAYALTVQVDNPYITRWQERAKEQLSVVTEAVRGASADKREMQYNLTVNGPRILYAAANGLNKAAIEGTRRVQDNVLSVVNGAGAAYEGLYRLVDHEGKSLLYRAGVLPTPEPTATPEPTPELSPEPTLTPTFTPDAGLTATQIPEGTPDVALITGPTPGKQTEVRDPATSENQPAETDGSEIKQTPVASLPPARQAPTEKGALGADGTPEPQPGAAPTSEQDAPETPDVAPTATPTPTPVPTPAPTPIIPPEAKPIGEATVYFFDASKYYHANASCANMKSAPARTLAEAAERGKLYCNACTPPALELMQSDLAVWCGTDSVFHIAGDCPALTAKWTAKTFTEAWIEDGMQGCPLCGSDLYIEAARQTPTETPVPAPVLPME